MQDVADELHVLLVVLDDEDLLARDRSRLLKRQREHEAAAAAGLALDANEAAVQLDQLLRKGEPA
jgi:hypothetical protein